MNNSNTRKRDAEQSVVRGVQSCGYRPWSTVKYCRTTDIDVTITRSGVLRTQKLKTHPLWTQISKVLTFKPGVGMYISLYATPPARNLFLTNVYPCPFTCIFSKTSSEFFLIVFLFFNWLWLTRFLCGPAEKKKGHLLIVTENLCRFPCWVSAENK